MYIQLSCSSCRVCATDCRCHASRRQSVAKRKCCVPVEMHRCPINTVDPDVIGITRLCVSANHDALRTTVQHCVVSATVHCRQERVVQEFLSSSLLTTSEEQTEDGHAMMQFDTIHSFRNLSQRERWCICHECQGHE